MNDLSRSCFVLICSSQCGAIMEQLSETGVPAGDCFWVESNMNGFGYKRFVDQKLEAERQRILSEPAKAALINDPSSHDRDFLKHVFKDAVDGIQIETSGYCNRRCSFCPNSFIDRHTENRHLDEDVYMKILSDLKEIDYDKSICLHRYNEPLADRSIVDRIRVCRDMLPEARLSLNTNGDYLDADYYRKLKSAGLDMIYYTIYYADEEVRTNESALSKCVNMLDRIDISYSISDIKSQLAGQSRIHVMDNGLSFEIYTHDLRYSYQFRGGLLTPISSHKFRREKLCVYPFRGFDIECNGNVMPCCNTRSEDDSHKKFIMGNVYERSVFEIWMSKAFINFRKHMLDYEHLSRPCNRCHY